MQTTSVKYQFSDINYSSIDWAPRLPDVIKASHYLEKKRFVSLTKDDGSHIVWYDDGIIIKTFPNGTEKVWYPKPTMQEILDGYKRWKGGYFRFHPDGTLEYRLDGEKYIWHSGVNPTVEHGHFEWPSVHYCGNKSCDGDCGVQSC